MKTSRARTAAALLCTLTLGAFALSLGACHEERDDEPPGPSPVDVKLDQHQKLVELMKQKQIDLVKAIEAHQRAHLAYLQAVSSQLASAKASAHAVTQAQEMTADADRIQKELVTAVQQAHQQLLDRADAASRLMRSDGQLWGVEGREFTTKEAAAQHAAAEVNALHEAQTELHVAQKKQQEALAALTDGEYEAWSQVMSDPKMRDVIDGKLDDERTAVDAAYTGLLDASLHYEAAADKVHRKLLGETKNKVRASKMQAMVDARAAAATTLARSRKALKDAIVHRAEARKQEIAYDGEFAVVIDGAFAKPKDREAFLARVKPQQDAAATGREKMHDAERALAETRKQLATLEADVQGMGY